MSALDKTDIVKTVEPAIVQPLTGVAGRIWRLWEKQRDAVFEIGRELIAARAQVEHGLWETWVDAELPFNRHSAVKFMAIAADSRLANGSHVNQLPSSWGTLYELSRLPDDVLLPALSDGRVTPAMERKDVARLSKPAEPDCEDSHLLPAIGDEAPKLPTIWNTPTQPKDGIAQNYAQLVWLLQQARTKQGLSRDDLDAATEWQAEYAGKLEEPAGQWGAVAVHQVFDWWLAGLGVGLKVVILSEGGN